MSYFKFLLTLKLEIFAKLYSKKEYDQIRFNCPQFVKHEKLLFSGKRISMNENDWKLNGYRCYTTEQKKVHLVLIWPGVYDSGINMGYNLAEAANFACKSWLSLGELNPVCACDETFEEPMSFNIKRMKDNMQKGKVRKSRCSRK